MRLQSLKYTCKHLPSGNVREEDILKNFEFIKEYGHLNNPDWLYAGAIKLINTWNLRGRGYYLYTLEPIPQ